MSDIEEDSVRWLQQLVDGNDEVVTEFVNRYLPSLQRLAKANMIPALNRRVGEDEVANSVCRTFLRRAGEGEFHLQSSTKLWRLLCAITLTKVRQYARFHYRQKRTIQRETPLALDDNESNAAHQYRDDEPSPDEALAFAECMQQLIDSLDAEERQFVELRLEGRSHMEISERLSCSERTVRRLLSRIRERWRQLLGDSVAD